MLREWLRSPNKHKYWETGGVKVNAMVSGPEKGEPSGRNDSNKSYRLKIHLGLEGTFQRGAGWGVCESGKRSS